MKTSLKLIGISIFITVLVSSCFNMVFEYGNGQVTQENRTVPAFTSVSSSGAFDIYYEYADTPSVIVSCESNLIQYIETAVFDNELKIRTPNFINLRPSKTIEVYVKGPEVERIDLSGSGLIHTDSISIDNLALILSGSGKIETTFYGNNLTTNISGSGEINVYAECKNYDVNVSGSGKITVNGFADSSMYNISGSGNVHAYDFFVDNADVKISGSGDLFLNVSDELYANISGSGNIYYIGNPKISTNTSGSGRVINKN